jgi:hypothetical protein
MGERAPSFFPKLEAKTFYGFQAHQMCNLCQVGIIRVAMMWCTKCKLKGSITSQTPLNWRGRPQNKQKTKSAQTTFNKSDSLPVQTSRCHQVFGHPFKHHGGLHIVVEWEHASKNVGLQHKVPAHSKQPSVIVAKRARYGRVNTTCHL